MWDQFFRNPRWWSLSRAFKPSLMRCRAMIWYSFEAVERRVIPRLFEQIDVSPFFGTITTIPSTQSNSTLVQLLFPTLRTELGDHIPIYPKVWMLIFQLFICYVINTRVQNISWNWLRMNNSIRLMFPFITINRAQSREQPPQRA